MWAWLVPVLNFLGGPVIKSIADGYKARLDAGNTSERIAADLATRELLIQQRELELNQQLKIAEIGKWYEPDHLFGYIMVIYFGTIIVYDKVLGSVTHHTTDPLAGDIATWAGWIMTFYVGMRGTQGLARILKR